MPGDEANDDLLHRVQSAAFDYFWRECNPENGLVADSTQAGSAASIAAVGFALTTYPIAVERGFVSREAALTRTLRTLRFFWHSPQGTEPDATGYKGFYYHFLQMDSGRRAWRCELSTIDTAILLAGALTAAQYFNADNAQESELRELADSLYQRCDWQWAQNGGDAVALGWRPERGFIRYRWLGYSEALILYMLGLGSPTYPLPPESYDAWTSTYRWKQLYGHEFVYAGPLFIHQFSHLWLDFRGIQDRYMSAKGIDYFENSRRATYVQRTYAQRNPRGFRHYDTNCWGITASDGPGPSARKVGGRHRRFHAYRARGVPYGPDDGTLAPWAAIASLPFAPEIVLPTLRYLKELHQDELNPYGFACSFNPTFPGGHETLGWLSPLHFGLNEGPMIIMSENYRSGLVWRLARGCHYLVTGLKRAGFSGGWLEAAI